MNSNAGTMILSDKQKYNIIIMLDKLKSYSFYNT